MTPLLPELAAPPDGLAVDGELVASATMAYPRNRAYWRYPLELEAARSAWRATFAGNAGPALSLFHTQKPARA